MILERYLTARYVFVFVMAFFTYKEHIISPSACLRIRNSNGNGRSYWYERHIRHIGLPLDRHDPTRLIYRPQLPDILLHFCPFHGNLNKLPCDPHRLRSISITKNAMCPRKLPFSLNMVVTPYFCQLSVLFPYILYLTVSPLHLKVFCQMIDSSPLWTL